VIEVERVRDAERRDVRFHAERGNEGSTVWLDVYFFGGTRKTYPTFPQGASCSPADFSQFTAICFSSIFHGVASDNRDMASQLDLAEVPTDAHEQQSSGAARFGGVVSR